MLDDESRAHLRVAVASVIRKLRHERGIAQERLALESTIDRGYMSAIERGQHSPSLETLWKLLYVLEIGFTDFGAELDLALSAPKPPHKTRRTRS